MDKVKNQELKLNLRPEKEKISGFPVSLLKSNLQKGIRRSNIGTAIKSAQMMLSKSPLDFWRRLPIILLEDVLLHPEMSKITRLSAEIKPKYCLPENEEQRKKDERFGLKIVEESVRCKHRDCEAIYYLKGIKDLTSLPDYEGKLDRISAEESELVKAIILRSKLGGMPGDMRFLEVSARVWFKRFSEKTFSVQELQNLFPKPKLNYRKISLDENLEDVPLEAVDFHISPILHILLSKDKVREVLRRHWPGSSEADLKDKLKDVIWLCRSALNTKEDLITGQTYDKFGFSTLPETEREKIQSVYQEIQTNIDGVSRWFIKESLKN